MHTSISKKTIIILLLIVGFSFNSSAQRTKSSLSAGQQVFAEKGLRDNRYFFYFLNASISNLGSDANKKLFKEAIQRDMLSQMLYLKFFFSDSFKELRKAQKILVDLYREILTNDIYNTVVLLKTFAPLVIKTKSYSAKHYLRLGFRDAAVAKIKMSMADNYREDLYSMRLYEYVRPIKKAKHGKRYAFYAALEAGTPKAYKSQWGYLGFKKINTLVQFKPALIKAQVPLKQQLPLLQKLYHIHDLNKVQKKIMLKRFSIRDNVRLKTINDEIKRNQDEIIKIDNSLQQKYTSYKSAKLTFTKLHHDNYYKVIGDKTFYDSIWQNPKLHELKEFNYYKNKD